MASFIGLILSVGMLGALFLIAYCGCHGGGVLVLSRHKHIELKITAFENIAVALAFLVVSIAIGLLLLLVSMYFSGPLIVRQQLLSGEMPESHRIERSLDLVGSQTQAAAVFTVVALTQQGKYTDAGKVASNADLDPLILAGVVLTGGADLQYASRLAEQTDYPDLYKQAGLPDFGEIEAASAKEIGAARSKLNTVMTQLQDAVRQATKVEAHYQSVVSRENQLQRQYNELQEQLDDASLGEEWLTTYARVRPQKDRLVKQLQEISTLGPDLERTRASAQVENLTRQVEAARDKLAQAKDLHRERMTIPDGAQKLIAVSLKAAGQELTVGSWAPNWYVWIWEKVSLYFFGALFSGGFVGALVCSMQQIIGKNIRDESVLQAIRSCGVDPSALDPPLEAYPWPTAVLARLRVMNDQEKLREQAAEAERLRLETEAEKKRREQVYADFAALFHQLYLKTMTVANQIATIPDDRAETIAQGTIVNLQELRGRFEKYEIDPREALDALDVLYQEARTTADLLGIQSAAAAPEGMIDYFQLLGLSPGAYTPGEIKTAYRIAAKTVHPDHNTESAYCHNLFVVVQEAYRVLSDPQLQHQYLEKLGK